jgi:hypothetical protein
MIFYPQKIQKFGYLTKNLDFLFLSFEAIDGKLPGVVYVIRKVGSGNLR